MLKQKKQNKAIAINESINVEAKTLSVKNCGDEIFINHPNPPLAPTHSPTTAPITDDTEAIFNPEIK